ncbi:ABC transporter substrate-binding protein [Aidingimonas halophila]|uniref:Iron complex transport system substrate-binding protein n=1 Tax=Aidingimonas halophila TaxID=574349 RepID=A0A1H2XH32_9GAMM|nr:ABC transporter substrate-binding protein [Aidingimonas halophila]GHC28724.1 ABC transporter substrate-binding protein [Aidingimonas halophila]SDW92192.1 iron complex transport system substrate-binding protein [Aidingimonas halophila]
MKFTGKVLATLCLLPAANVLADTTSYPLTLSNCGQEISFQSAPDNIVTVGQSATEILYALGLSDRVTGTSVWFNPVLPEFRDVNADIERIADNDPSFEAVVNKKPELVAAQYEWHVGPSGSVATREQFHDLGIATYIMPADCDTKDNTTGGDGTRTDAFSPDSVYKGITELATIFDVQDAGDALVADFEAREKEAVARAERLELPEDLSAVFWFSSPEQVADPYVAGQLGAPGYMMDKLGIRNVVESDEEWPVVGWETIARADPDIIVVAHMDRRRYPADDVEKKLEFLENDPVAREMSAVKNGNIIEMDAHAMSATMRTILGLETLADALSTLSFDQ